MMISSTEKKIFFRLQGLYIRGNVSLERLKKRGGRLFMSNTSNPKEAKQTNSLAVTSTWRRARWCQFVARHKVGFRVLSLMLALAGLMVSASPARGQAPGLVWTTNIGAQLFAVDSQTNLYATTNGMVIQLTSAGVPFATNSICPLPGLAQRDAAGNYYFAGTFDGTQDFGGITLVGGLIVTETGQGGTISFWTPGYPSCFLAKYDAHATLQWVTPFVSDLPKNPVYQPGATFATVLNDMVLNDDGNVLVSYSNPLLAHVACINGKGTNLWIATPFLAYSTFLGSQTFIKLSRESGTNGCFLVYEFDRILFGVYDSSGSFTTFAAPTPLIHNYFECMPWAKPVLGSSNSVVAVGEVEGVDLSPFDPPPPPTFALVDATASGSLAWTQTVDSMQCVLGSDVQTNFYLSETNGSFSKRDLNGNLIWSNTFSVTATNLLVDSQNNRFVQFTDGSIAALQSDPTLQAPSIVTNPSTETVFVGDNASFSVSAAGPAPLYYQWFAFGTNVSESTTSPALNLNSAQPSQSGPYVVVVTNPTGSVTSNPAMLRVKSVELYVEGQLLTNGTYVFGTQPVFSVRSAFVNGSSYYTLDGSAPDFTGIPYTGPFTLAQSATVRAMGYSEDFTRSEEADPVNAVLPAEYTLSVSTPGGGSVAYYPTGGVFTASTVVSLVALPAPGWSFLSWQGDASGANPSNNITMDGNKSVAALFGTTLSTTTVGSGQVVLTPPGGLYAYGRTVQLIGMPQPGNFFGAWGNAGSGTTNPLFYTVTSATPTISSIFGALAANQSALTVLVIGHGTVGASPQANVYTTGQAVALTATPAFGESFLGWSGDANGTQNPLSITLDRSKVITANFSGQAALKVNLGAAGGFGPTGIQLSLASDPDGIYKILSSTNLVDWTSLGYVTNSLGTIQVGDPAATNSPSRFYKISP
jgi:hypothetical protein